MLWFCFIVYLKNCLLLTHSELTHLSVAHETLPSVSGKSKERVIPSQAACVVGMVLKLAEQDPFEGAVVHLVAHPGSPGTRELSLPLTRQ